MSIRIIRLAFRLGRFLSMLFHLMTPSLCLLFVDVNVFVLIGTMQTASTAHLNFCQRVVNKHTIIDSHCASSSSEPLDTLFVSIRIIMLRILPGFFSSTIQNSWAIIAPPKAITVVIQEVLRFWSTLTKLSPSIRCDVPSGGCCMFSAGLQVDRLKQARGLVSETPVKLFFTWLFFCTSITREPSSSASLSVWDLRALCWKRCVTSSRSRHRLLGELYSARIIYCSIGCSHPGAWRIPISDQSSSCFYQFPHCLLHEWL